MNNLPTGHEALIEVGREADAIDTRFYESQLGSIGQLSARVLAVSEAALAALERVMAEHDDAPGHDPEDTLVSGPCDVVVNVAFVAHWDLRQRADRLERLGRTPDPWLVITECASLRRHIVKSMIEVEQTLCRATNASSELTYLQRSDLDTALASRHAYQNFTRRIRAIEARLERGQVDAFGALRLSAANIAILIGRDIYEELRVSDRRQLRSLQERVFVAVRSPNDELAIRRTWMDLCASAALLARVHERDVLVQHDHDLIRDALAQLEAGRFDATELERLRQLEGREPQLDQLLNTDGPSPTALASALAEVQARLARQLGHAPAHVDAAPAEPGSPAQPSVASLSWA